MAERIQHCFGDYERKFCNGDADSDDIYESLPCNRRDVCEAFRLYLREVGKDRINYFTIEQEEDENGEEVFFASIEDEESFLEFCGKLVDRYGTHAKRIKKKRYKVVDKKERKKKKKKITKAAQKEREIRCKNLMSNRTAFLNEILENFCIELSVKLPLGCAVVEDGVLPLPGQLFLVKRTDFFRRGMVSVYMKGYASNDLEIVRLFPRYAQWKFFAVFMFEKDYIENCLQKDLFEFLEFEIVKGQPRTKNLDRVGISLLAEAIALFFEKGLIVPKKMVGT